MSFYAETVEGFLLAFAEGIGLFESTEYLVDNLEWVEEALILVTLAAVLSVHRYLTVIIDTRLFSADLIKFLCSF